MANYFDNVVGVKHAVAESSRLLATNGGAHIFDLKITGTAGTDDKDNGSIVTVGDFVEGQTFKAKAYTEGGITCVLITPPIAYNTAMKSYSNEEYFYNAVGEIARGYQLVVGDIYTVSATAFGASPATAPAVGKYVDEAYAVTASAPATGFYGEIIEEVNYQNSKSYRIFVKRV